MLVPEQFTMQTQKDLCFAHPAKGILNIDVLSFERLAYRIFQEVGHDSRTIIDDEGKNLILRRVAGECKDELVILKKNLKKQGYINEVIKKGWSYDRLGAIEKAILINGCAEFDLKEVEAAVIINESVELAKKFCDEDTYKLINRILDVI